MLESLDPQISPVSTLKAMMPTLTIKHIQQTNCAWRSLFDPLNRLVNKIEPYAICACLRTTIFHEPSRKILILNRLKEIVHFYKGA
jgi:hypothetical protein